MLTCDLGWQPVKNFSESRKKFLSDSFNDQNSSLASKKDAPQTQRELFTVFNNGNLKHMGLHETEEYSNKEIPNRSELTVVECSVADPP